MTPHEVAGLAAAVTQVMDERIAVLRDQHDRAIERLQTQCTQLEAAARERAAADAARIEQLQQQLHGELEATRETGRVAVQRALDDRSDIRREHQAEIDRLRLAQEQAVERTTAHIEQTQRDAHERQVAREVSGQRALDERLEVLRAEHAQELERLRQAQQQGAERAIQRTEEVARSVLHEAGARADVENALGEHVAELERRHAQELERLHDHDVVTDRAHDESIARAQARIDELQRELADAREAAAGLAIQRALFDGDGVLHLLQRNGDTVEVPVADPGPRIAAAADQRAHDTELRLSELVDAQVARALQKLGLAHEWTKVAAYTASSVVACYIGRTYRLRDGVKASIGQEPGEHPDVWERIGAHGLRVHKAKPPHPEPGDIYTEADARFIFDGVNTILLAPRGVKQSEVMQAIKPVAAMTQANAERVDAVERRVDGVERVARSGAEAANDARAWIDKEGDAAVIRSAQALAWQENRTALIDSPELARVVKRAPEIDTLLDQEAG